MMVNKTLHSELLQNIKYNLNEKRIVVTHLFAQHLLYVHCSMECLKRTLVGYSPWSRKELDMTEQLTLLLSLWDKGSDRSPPQDT